MNEKATSSPYVHDEWSVTLDGRYVVRFCGVNAQELATRQLHELAELLGFDEPLRHVAGTSGSAEAVDNTSAAANTAGKRRRPR